MKKNNINPDLYGEVERLGARDMEACMQCGNCASACPLSTGENTFPRKIYRYLQLGLKDKLLESPEPWLCYYCGECNIDCPRGAEPAETMMAARRWLTTEYDWTGLARRFYLSEKWEFGALGAVSLFVILLFTFFHGPVITDRVAVNSFAPVMWVEIGDLTMAAILSFFLLSNAFRMYRLVMNGTKVPLHLYVTEGRTFVQHFLTQRRWGQCGEDKSRWLKHLVLVSGYLTMMTLVIVFIRWFQVDDSSWHFSAIFGYYATAVLLIVTVEMFRSRIEKQEKIHRFSHPSDWLFLTLLFFTTLTGIIMHLVRLIGWPMGTYVIYVIHLAIAVPMLVVEVPFGKWSHLFYRPLAVFLTTVKEKAQRKSEVDPAVLLKETGETFQSCMQCGACAGICPQGEVVSYSPRKIIRNIAMGTSSNVSVDDASWTCATCNSCVEQCPRGIGILDLIKSVRRQIVDAGNLPGYFKAPVKSLKDNANPWGGQKASRLDWVGNAKLPEYAREHEYCLFTCCATAFDTSAGKSNQTAGIAFLRLLEHAGVSYGTLGNRESCCGDMADKIGTAGLASDLAAKNTEMFLEAGVSKILTTSPHCLNSFRKNYEGLKNIAAVHSTELLDQLVREGRIKPANRLDLKVTYHDPCYLGRHLSIYDAPRRILKSIPGVTLFEMQNDRERSFCCGGGGGGPWKDSSGGESLGEIRIREALDTGAGIIATACPYCMRTLNESIAKLGVANRIKVCDVAELLLRSVDPSDK
ncbi:MAG: 4Fe-4S dicluster domain-containing protein [Desulfobacteraceae bacterium]|nr:4Fe-4S dicluster domain-containing protein [Desulfobacteraceae bacterium]